MCRLRNIAMPDYQKCDYQSVTTRQTDGQTYAGKSDPYVPLCFTGDTKIMHFVLDRHLVIHMLFLYKQ